MKKNLMKILSLVLALSMVLCFAACSGDEEVVEETEAVEETVTHATERALKAAEHIYKAESNKLIDLIHPDVLDAAHTLSGEDAADIEELADSYDELLKVAKEQMKVVNGEVVAEAGEITPCDIEAMDLSLYEFADVAVKAAEYVEVTISSTVREEKDTVTVNLLFVLADDDKWYLDPFAMDDVVVQAEAEGATEATEATETATEATEAAE